MSELIEIRDNRAILRCQFLATASALVLMGYVAANGEACADDSGKPTVWIELGGQMEMMQGTSSPFTAPFMFVQPTPGPYQEDSLVDAQKTAHHSFGLDGKVSFQPEGSDWILSAGIRYGRSKNRRHVHHQTAADPIYVTFYFEYYHNTYQISSRPVSQAFADTRQTDSESHAVIDFQAGRDIGIGVLGRHGSSILNAGVRFAQFSTDSSTGIIARPSVNHQTPIRTLYSGYISFPTIRITNYHYSLKASAHRSFTGIGPSLSWNGSATLLGNPEDGSLDLDYGINGALLFGRQKVKTSHSTEAYHYKLTTPDSTLRSYAPLYAPRNAHSTRSRSVIVPNLGGFAGLSVKYPNAKVSLGYRADFFFGATDTGIDARRTSDLGFHGPFATISIGLGG